MLSRMNKRSKARSEGGFTLIELLVVIIIIGILAAIAIPMYLQQRKKGWHANAESAVRNAAVAMESYYTGPGDGHYTGGDAAGVLEAEGWIQGNNIDDLTIVANDQDYTITTDDLRDAGCTYTYDSATGAPAQDDPANC